MEWTAERIDELKSLIASGHSRGQIATIFNCNRNVIVGKAYRLGLCQPAVSRSHVAQMGALVTNGRATQRVQNEIRLGLRPPKRKPPQLKIVPRPDEPAPLLVSLRDLEDNHCHWLCEGTDDNCYPQYCGHPSVDGRWCSHHHGRVYEARR